MGLQPHEMMTQKGEGLQPRRFRICPSPPQDIRTFFITSVTANRRRLFAIRSNAELLIEVLTQNRQKGRFQLHAFVIMPDHLHLLLTPAHDVSLEKAMQYIKGGFSFRLQSKLDVWEKSFQEHRLKDRSDYANHVVYIEQNPVNAGLAVEACDFPYSSLSKAHLVDCAPGHLGC